MLDSLRKSVPWISRMKAVVFSKWEKTTPGSDLTLRFLLKTRNIFFFLIYLWDQLFSHSLPTCMCKYLGWYRLLVGQLGSVTLLLNHKAPLHSDIDQYELWDPWCQEAQTPLGYGSGVNIYLGCKFSAAGTVALFCARIVSCLWGCTSRLRPFNATLLQWN